MDKLIVKGPVNLNGEVKISRAKNACLPILASLLLFKKTVRLKNIPKLRDIQTMMKLLENFGIQIESDGPNDGVNNGDYTRFNSEELTSFEAPYDLVKTMRAGVFVLGPLLSRLKKARVSLPGGCAIGTRPIDIHLSNLEKMGAKIKINGGYVEAQVLGGLIGTSLHLAFPSVGATENLMMAAVYAKGTTVILNAAMEPEIEDLANFLNLAGAKIRGAGTSTITIDGIEKDSLESVEYEPISDRIEAATYICLGLATSSQILIKECNPEHLSFVIDILKEMGAKLEVGNGWVKTYPSALKPSVIDTAPYPGFPTDAQAQMMALMTQIEGASIITEHIFENRFMHVPELVRLGADIVLKGKSAFIEGGKPLTGAPIMCTDLRASAALVIAACVSSGETEIQRIYHLERGYENLEGKLKKLGASIERIKA